ncbi:MAG: VOC family protein [Chloroflexi bacterium]|nr:VOC family protein [Chloroflexota bacterium]
MLSTLEVIPTIPAHDLQRARRFYADKLGLVPTREAPDGLMYECKNSGFLLYETQYAGTARNTAMSWATDNLDREMRDLRAKGVIFEEYDLPGLKTINGVATMGKDKGAWFKDSEGNILALTQMSR